MTRPSPQPGRHSLGCGSRINARTLAEELQGEVSMTRAFEGYAAPLQHPAHAVLARPRPPRPRLGLVELLQMLITRLRSWFQPA